MPRILFICTAAPFGEAGGSGIRTRHIARLLAKVGPVTLVAATANAWTPEQVERTREAYGLARFIKFQSVPNRSLPDQVRKALDPRFLNTHGLGVSPDDARFVAEQVEAHDVTWIHGIKTANALGRFRWPRTVLDIDDFPSAFYRASGGLSRSLLVRLKSRHVAAVWRRRERTCIERFPVLVVCKDEDRALFGPPERVLAVPNGFEAPAPVPRSDMNGPCLGMIGDFNYLPNEDGLRWFVEQVWPAVRAQVPTATLRLVGRSSPERAARFAQSGVVGLGYVPDPAAEIASWSAMIVPTRLGGGTHLKVAEGLARRVSIVSTAHGVRGYRVMHDRHVFVADSPLDFSARCVQLLRDPAIGHRLATAGWELFQQSYAWDSLAPTVAAAVETVSRVDF
ncbi:MAG: glycosyltransferase [Opitutaceae bacterium]|nr:glycosyltransferase [Opitutaceae bacterium]